MQQDELRKKYEIDRNIIEKGQIEKMRKEEEIQRQKFLTKEQVIICYNNAWPLNYDYLSIQLKNATVDILKQQVEFRKESEKAKKEQEMLEYNQQLLRSVNFSVISYLKMHINRNKNSNMLNNCTASSKN